MKRERTRLTTRLKPRRVIAAFRYRRCSRIDLICEQDVWWVDRHGRWHDVRKISPNYQAALLDYLRTNAKRLQPLRFLTRPCRGGPYDDHFEDDIAELLDPAAAWIERQPLVRRLRELAA